MMVISGFMLITVKGKTDLAIEQLQKLPGVEVHLVEQGVKVVLTLEAPSVDESYRIGEAFKEIDGIVSICLAYTHFEDDPAMEHKRVVIKQ
ncbi:chaperone NapD [Bacillaceae bacterium IKA-2]|nr:chaperone NapD [Bacillaceae bacterium IKA-2]